MTFRRLKKVGAPGVFLAFVATAAVAPAGAETPALTSAVNHLSLATLDWPPFTGSGLPGQGPVSETVRQGFLHAGVAPDIQVIPWKRAIARAESPSSPVIAYFPGYHCRHRPGFVASMPIGTSQLGLAERVDDDKSWAAIEDLETMRIGVVAGYANTDAFDLRVGDGRIRTSAANTDADNLRQLFEGAVEMAVVDSDVFDWLMARNDVSEDMRRSVRMDGRLLDERPLYVCFVDTPRGRHFKERFDAAVKVLDLPMVFRDKFRAMVGGS